MAGSVQGSAIDDSFETLTNAPDAWASGRNAAPVPVDYQHYVEPGDARSAVDDRCFTEYGAVEYPHHNNNMARPAAKSDQKRHRSSTKAQGKRRPSPSFRIRSKDGDSLVVSNPFVLRKTSRPPPSEAASSEQTEEASQHSSSSAARSRTYQIRIRGKNGEEAVQEIKRPLCFASQSGRARGSQDATAVGDESDTDEVKYWSANSSQSTPKREHKQKPKSKSGPTTFTQEPTTGPTTFVDFVTDTTPGVAPSSVGSSVKMSGALPCSSPASTTCSSRSRLLPPEKPASSIHDSVISSYSPRYNTGESSKDPSRYAPSMPSSHVPSQQAVIIVPDDSLEGSVTAASFSALSTHAIVSSRPVSPASCTSSQSSQSSSSDSVSKLSSNPSARPPISSCASTPNQSVTPSQHAATASRHSATTSQKHSALTQDHLEEPWSPAVTVSRYKPEESREDAYYNWKVPKDSLYSSSAVKTVSPSSRRSSHSGGVPLDYADISGGGAFWDQAPSALPSVFSPFPEEHIEDRIQEIASETSQRSTHKSQSTHHTSLSSSHKSPLKTKRSQSSLADSRQPSHPASRESLHDDQAWGGSSSRGISAWKTAAPSEHTSHQTVQDATEWEQAAEWEAPPSSHRSNPSRASTSHRSRSHKSKSSHHHSREESEQNYAEWESAEKTEKGSNRTSRSASAINIQEELLEYLPSDDERLPPPMPMLTTIYEEPEPSIFNRTPTMLTQENVRRFARPGAISPHPLSSVSSAATARKPPTIEPHRLEYQRPYVESKSTSSGSSGAHRNGHSRRSSRHKMSDEQAYQSAHGDGRSRSSREDMLENAHSEGRSKASAKVSVGGWKLW